MKVLSLLQPWASLIVTPHPTRTILEHGQSRQRGIKEWETRCWKPKDPALIYVLQTDGFLVHASIRWNLEQKQLVKQWPFSAYSNVIQGYPLGMIIGHVKLDKIWTTDRWVSNFSEFETEGPQEEYRFGDYSPGRFAWLLREPVLFKKPILAKGCLGLWNYEFDKNAIALQ